MNPQDLKYSKTHEWVRVEEVDGAQLATIGITDFAVKQLTDLVYIELPDVGRTVAAGDSIGEIESVKAVSDLYCPVAGEIVEVNEPLADSLESFSSDPFGAGWVARVRLAENSGLDDLMDFAAYQKQCAEEA